MKIESSCCATFASRLSSACYYPVKFFKVILLPNVVIGSLVSFASRSFFGGEQLQGFPTGVILAAGTFGIAAATRAPAIYSWLFPEEKPVLKLTEEEEIIEEKPNPSACRKFLGKTANYTLRGVGVFQMGITFNSTLLGLSKAASYIPSNWTLLSHLSNGLIVHALLSFMAQYWVFNLKLNAFKNADKFEKCVLTGEYFDAKVTLKALGISSFNVMSGPFVAYFSVVEGIPKILFLKDILTGDHLHNFGISAAVIGGSSNFIMGIPSVYYAIKDGTAVYLPDEKSTCAKVMSCGLTENRWKIIKNGFVYPFGTLDNLGAGAFTYKGVSYTLPKLMGDYTPTSPGVIIVSALSGISSAITGFAFNTRGGMIKLLPNSFKKQVKVIRKKASEAQLRKHLLSASGKNLSDISPGIPLSPISAKSMQEPLNAKKGSYNSLSNIPLEPLTPQSYYGYNQSDSFFKGNPRSVNEVLTDLEEQAIEGAVKVEWFPNDIIKCKSN
jgi:hypothetical protein